MENHSSRYEKTYGQMKKIKKDNSRNRTMTKSTAMQKHMKSVSRKILDYGKE